MDGGLKNYTQSGKKLKIIKKIGNFIIKIMTFKKSNIDGNMFLSYTYNMNIHQSLYNFMRTYRPKQNSIALTRGGFSMRFNRFFKEIDRVAAGLYKMGVRRGDVVMIALPNIPQSIVATYALSRLGAIASMIHPKLSQDEFGEAVEKQNPKVIFLGDINLSTFYPRRGNAKCIICHFFLYDYMGLPHAKYFEPYDGDGEEIMFYMHSGGTSGAPKTVMLSSRATNSMAGNLLHYLTDKFNENNAMLVVLPLFHGFGLCIGMHASISTNMRAVLQPIFNAKKTTKIIARERVTTMLAVPRMVSKLLSYDKFRGHNISCIEDVFVGGDLVGDDLVEEFDKRMKECGGHGKLSPGYGLTESCSVCAVTKGEYISGTVGKAIDSVNFKIVDDNLNEVEIGQMGELLINAEQVMSGYLGDEAATKEALVDIDGKKWLRTGDLFKTDNDNNLYFLGRKKRLIKISGMNVFPVEIERIARELPFVNDCACIEYRVNNKPFIKLLVEGRISEDQKGKVIAHIAKRMSHWSIPKVVECVDVFPRTKIGKIDILELNHEYSQNN